MVKRRAISKEDKALEPKNLPLLYNTLVPLLADRHASLYLHAEKDFDFARKANAVPVTVEEFPLAQRDYPIVFSSGENPMPLVLLGYQSGINDQIEKDGTWRKGSYVPAYLRRYPFALVRESEEATRNILCADLSSVMFVQNGAAERALFRDNAPGELIKAALDYCQKFETAMTRTRAAMQELTSHGLLGPATVSITRDGKTLKVEGFQTLSEEKLRELPDEVLAGFMRRGIGTIISAHLLSLSRFATMGPVA